MSEKQVRITRVPHGNGKFHYRVEILEENTQEWYREDEYDHSDVRTACLAAQIALEKR